MSLLNFLLEKIPSDFTTTSSDNLQKNNSSVNYNKYNKNTRQELSIQLEDELTQKYNIPIKILLCEKKHSSGRIKQNSIELRISKKLPKEIQRKHIESITQSLYLKICKNPNLLSTTSTNISCLRAIRKGYFYIEDIKILILYNQTKTRFKVESNYDEITTCITKGIYASHKDVERSNIAISIPQQYLDENIVKQNIGTVEKTIAKILCQELQPIISKRVHELNQQTLKSKLGEISLNYVSSKWGHCTTRNNIMIHISLFNAPREVFEYVILHELAHTIHKNHSTAYWNLCNSLTPHTKYAKKYLKESPPSLFK